jgi:hypothetical protein
MSAGERASAVWSSDRALGSGRSREVEQQACAITLCRTVGAAKLLVAEVEGSVPRPDCWVRGKFVSYSQDADHFGKNDVLR